MAKITREEAIEKIKGWSLMLEATDPSADGFNDAIESLILPVMNERLDFDSDKEVFTLLLKKPIENENSNREIIELHELTLAEQKVLQKYKDSEGVDRSEAFIAKAAGITLGEASKIGTRDLSVASAILTVFFS